jgi:hypothetical protein
MSESQEEFIKVAYDHAVNGFRACCRVDPEVTAVMDGLSEVEIKKILSAAKSGWIRQMKFLDKVMAKEGEP